MSAERGRAMEFPAYIRYTLGVLGLLASSISSGTLLSQTVSLVYHNEIIARPNPVSFALGDFNRDGVLDLAVLNQGSTKVAILRGLGNGNFAPFADHEVGVGPVALATGDFNGDGILDLVVANNISNSVSLLLGNGNGTFRAFTTLEAYGPTALAIADFNHDGRLDLAV